MEKFFRPSRWFVLFCAILIVMWGALQVVATMRLQETAKLVAVEIFSWHWPSGIEAKATIDDVKVLKRTETEAIVRVSGKEQIQEEQIQNNCVKSPACVSGQNGLRNESIECKALLTFYRAGKRWLLARVEFQ